MMLLLELFLRFFFCGLFSIGGGLATLPFLYDISEATGWFTSGDISNMIAISESTPGPLGVNMATYVGYQTAGVPGALIAPLSLIFPSLIIIIVISRILERFKTSALVQNALYGLRAASTALIAAAGIGVAKIAFFHMDEISSGAAAVNVMDFFNWKALCLAVVVWAGFVKFKKHPIVYIVFSAAVGIVLQF